MAVKVLPVEPIAAKKMIKNNWNPNKMEELKFNALSDSIQDIGFSQNVQVIPVELLSEEQRAELPEEAEYMIVNGEQRWEAVRMLDPDAEISCVVWGRELLEQGLEEDERKKILLEIKGRTTRMDLLHGDIDPTKFAMLYDEIRKGLGKPETHRVMGITSEAVLREHVKKAASGLPESMAAKVKGAADRLQSVDDLSAVLSMLMEKYGSDLDRSFLFFVFGKRSHLMVELQNRAQIRILDRFAEVVRQTDVDMAEVLCALIDGWASEDHGIEK